MDAEEFEIELAWRGRRRRAIVFAPMRRVKPAPLVLAFHGSGVNARQMVGFSGLNETASRHGFVVAYPNGEGRVERARTWNAGLCCGHAHHHQIDDVGFVARLMDEFVAGNVRQGGARNDADKAVIIDPERIYLTGFSNGAMMCYRLASELASRIAAIAPIAGPMAIEECRPELPMPICHFHSDQDRFTPFEGGRGDRSVSKVEFFSVGRTLSAWIQANGCQLQPLERVLPQRVADGTRVSVRRYLGGAGGAEVVLYLIHGAGHVWPGQDSGMQVLGKPTANLDANEVMWRFFERFHRSG